MKIYGFIFARGGSKGLPGKNIKPLGGIPLIGRAINTARETGRIERVIVSTDDEAIAAVAREYGAEVPFMRPAELARDDAPEWKAWQHAIGQVGPFDVFVSLPCTAPLRSAGDVNRCIDLFLAGDCDMVITTREAERHPSFNMVTIDAEGNAAIAMPPAKEITRRQDAPPVYDMTTVAYVASPQFILSHDRVFAGRVKAVEIPKERAVDIDTPLDFAIAKALLEMSHEEH